MSTENMICTEKINTFYEIYLFEFVVSAAALLLCSAALLSLSFAVNTLSIIYHSN